MHLSLLFWLGLAVPGYVLVRRLSRDDLESGLLGTLGLSYLAVLGLLSPVSIVCYLLEAPLWVFSAACWALFLAAAGEVTRRRWWRDLGKLLAAGACIELAIVVLDMILGARTGAFLEGDARVHLARIRLLVDHGFSNADPYVAAKFFFPTYHTNILHALYAACVQVTGVDHFGVWSASLVWAKLLVAAGGYYVAWCVFERRWAAWATAVCVVGIQGPVSFVVYPNTLAPYWLIPYMLGFAVQAIMGQGARQSGLKLGVGSLVLGQVHGLYAGFAAVLLGPLLGAVLLWRLLRRRAGRWAVGAGLLALTVGLPFPLVSRVMSRPATAGAKTAVESVAADRSFLHFDNGWVMKRPPGFTAGGWRLVVLGVGIVAALATSQRRRAGCVVAVVLTCALVLYTPMLCTVALRVLGAGWILGRFAFVLRLGVIVLLPGAVVFLLERWVRRWWGRGLVSCALLALAIPYAGHTEPLNWRTYLDKAFGPREDCRRALTDFRMVSEFLGAHMPVGRTVLVDPDRGMWVVMCSDYRIVLPASSHNGVLDLVERREDLAAMLAKDTPWPRRRELLGKYDIQFFMPTSEAGKWAFGHVREDWNLGQYVLLRLDTSP